jgi:pimeloyl-ACP methyl ester carboxylesterase
MPFRSRRRTRPGTALRTALAVSLTAAFTAALGAPASATPTFSTANVVDLPITFSVVNQNRTGIPCAQAPDGKTYTVHGSLVAPKDLIRPDTPAATLYLHGLGYGGWFFHLTDVPAYDYATQQAAQGHVSVVIDRLGNPAHDELQDGNATCLPAQADMADQIANALKAGRYEVGGAVRPRFQRILLAGHSAGGLIAEMTQAIFRPADAVAVISYTHYPSPLAFSQFSAAGQDCLTAPQPSHGATGAPNYAPFGRSDADFEAGHFYNVDPAVAAIVLRKRNRDACGDLMSALQGLLATSALTSVIEVPVLLITGEKDALFSPPFDQVETQTGFPGAPKLGVVEVKNAGHAITLSRSHEEFRSLMAQWLAQNGA